MNAHRGLRWQDWTRQTLTEQEPAPLDLSDTEILDWLAEYCDQSVYNRPTPQYRGGFTLYCDGIRTTASSLRDAVCLAAAKFEGETHWLKKKRLCGSASRGSTAK